MLPKFVENRVNKIRKFSCIEFYHISGKENPADLPTRGCSLAQLRYSKIWWKGPLWLKITEDEFGKAITWEETMVNISTGPSHPMVDAHSMVQAGRFSSWAKLKRVVSYCLRFIKKISRKLGTEKHGSLFDMLNTVERVGPITANEMTRATHIIVAQSQRAHFGDCFGDHQGKTTKEFMSRPGIVI